MSVRREVEYRDGNGFIAEIIRTDRRKTADVRIEEGAVSVIVPRETSLDRIDRLLKDKRPWIKEKIALQQEITPASPKQFVSGEAFSYLGRNYRLKVVRGNFKPVKLVGGQLVATLPEGAKHPHMVRNALVRWYKRQAEQNLPEKVARFAPIVGVESAGVGIKSFKSRWGSCTSKGKIEFSWRIMTAPNSLVNYVVIHELCHIAQPNHSKDFWTLVSRFVPDYEERRLQLKLFGGKTYF